MENIKILKMNFNHLDAIKDDLENEYDDFWNFHILEEELKNENSLYIVAIKENEIIGFAGIKYNFENVELMNIVVKKKYRKQGFGYILLKEIINKSSEFDTSKIGLEVSEKNIGAIELYKKVGFKQVGIRKKYYNGKDDAILMDYYL